MGAASASSVGASQHKALVFSAWSHLRKQTNKQKSKMGSTVGKEGERMVPTSPVQSIHNYCFIFLTAENTIVKYAA